MSKWPDDPALEAAKAVPLADAFREHADPKVLKQYRHAQQRLEREGQWQYVGNRDKPDGYVLSEFDGLGHELLKESRELLARIEADFVGKLRCGDLTAWARDHARRDPAGCSRNGGYAHHSPPSGRSWGWSLHRHFRT